MFQYQLMELFSHVFYDITTQFILISNLQRNVFFQCSVYFIPLQLQAIKHRSAAFVFQVFLLVFSFNYHLS